MCDTLVATSSTTKDRAVWLAKNSDREPGEAQAVEHHLARAKASGLLRCTHVEIEDAAAFEVLLSRPAWMWGAEMGVNERGLAIGNEAVFTRLPVRKTGLTGMDLLRLALERAASAREAIDVITRLLDEVGQGGRCGFRNRAFRYHNSYLLADPEEAWVLETADLFWAAKRIRGVCSISNGLTLGSDFDLVHDGAFSFAKQRGWAKRASDFSFADAFADPLYRDLTGAGDRRATTMKALEDARGDVSRDTLFAALRSHAGCAPDDGWRMKMPCAHASCWPTRHAGQSTASMVFRLAKGEPLAYATGTSSPCLSVFKPIRLGLARRGRLLAEEPVPRAEGFDDESLFWRHERLHRAVLQGYAERRAAFDDERRALEAEALSSSGEEPGVWFARHREALPRWLSLALAKPRPPGGPFSWWWSAQSRKDRVPA